MRHPKRRYAFTLFIFLMLLIAIGLLWRHSTTEDNQNITLPSYVVFQDKIASTALGYCHQQNPEWRCTGVTLCAWPNGTATAVVYANYTIKCLGSTCYSVNGTFYRVIINTTKWEVIEFEPENTSIVDEVISECERIWNTTEKGGASEEPHPSPHCLHGSPGYQYHPFPLHIIEKSSTFGPAVLQRVIHLFTHRIESYIERGGSDETQS